MSKSVLQSKVPLPVYVEHFFRKYRVLSSVDLSILIMHNTKLAGDFDKFHKYISTILNKFKKAGRVTKVGQKKWQWIHSENEIV